MTAYIPSSVSEGREFRQLFLQRRFVPTQMKRLTFDFADKQVKHLFNKTTKSSVISNNPVLNVGKYTAYTVPLPVLSHYALISAEPSADRDLSAVVSEVALQLLQYLDINSSWEYGEISRRMCEAYPAIQRRPGKHPWAVFRRKLSQKVRKIRWKTAQERKAIQTGDEMK